MQFSLVTLSIALFILIIFSAFFSGSEIGMMSINRYRLKHWVKNNNRQAVRVFKLLQRPDKLLGVILIGNTFANIMASMLATLIGQRLFGSTGVALAALLLTLIILVFSEMLPKTLAALHPQQAAFRVSLPLMLLQRILAPLVYIISAFNNGILRLSGISLDKVQRDALTGEELRSVVNEAGGLLPAEHQGMLISLLDLEEATVEDIMIPKVDIVGIDLEQPWHEILDELETAQHTRLPLFRNSIDDLVGMVHVRNVLNLVLEEKLDKEGLLRIADAPYFVPEATPLNVQLLNFRKEKKRSCFVVDEYGDLQGLVTIEDILEEVIGEFTTDIAALSKDIVQEEDNTIIVDASITLRHLKRGLGWQLPMIGPRTLSGLIIEHLGYIPTADSCLQIEDFQIEILKVGDNMVKTARMRKINKKENQGD
ncbi:Mg2+ and Co2+ transporter CorB, hemolysin [Legionella birminghamensis]|uniref:Mg2+ and Co2+ transporter CorB, hemolysin n=1 Tax=Legionella birminghamensis TaxID=28083 RepID=A0A378IDC9_9GAMM|nr:HlyC/CorC family transporter [Legionella birminghamensis]KTC66831.1 Mg2+ and Co2+ transporter CorB, hemolysin [Legionella birminghamensis]STX32956.1 Mg2+ and Co2+ transporter CorB, hemolysin [Legionella birminghamensis]